MTTVRGHRAAEHTADEFVEAWGPTRAACLEEAGLGLVALFAAPCPSAPHRPHETTLDGHDPAMLLLALLDEIVYLADAEGAVPVTIRVRDRGAQVDVALDLVDVRDVKSTGPAPKGVSHSELDLRADGDRWTARALIDI